MMKVLNLFVLMLLSVLSQTVKKKKSTYVYEYMIVLNVFIVFCFQSQSTNWQI